MYNCQRERIIVSFRRTDDQAILRMWIKSASDTVYLCSFQKNGYASGHVLRCGPCFPQLSVAANLSYPAGFSDKRRPQFLRSASPQMGAAAAPIRGHASRCNSNAARAYLKTPQYCPILPERRICCVAFACIPQRSAALMRLASAPFWRMVQHF